MKKLIYLLAAVAALFAFSSCTKENISPAPEVEGKTVNIRFSAANAGDTKTGVTYESGTYAPYWNKGDKIGVIFDDFTDKSNVDAVLANANETGKTASFYAEGVSLNNDTEPGEAGKVYSFYPASAFQSGSVGDKTVRVNVKSTQTPAAVGTFDPEADILVGMPSDYLFDNSDKSFVADIPFARVMSVVKITLKAGVECPENLAVNKLTMTAPEGTVLTGRVKLSLNTISGGDSPLSDWTVKNKEVSAIYDGEKPVIGGTANTVYLIVNPTSIESGSDVIFTIDTEGYTIEKTVNLKSPLAFPQGNVANIGLTIAGTNCTPKVAETRIWVESFENCTSENKKQYTISQTGAKGTGLNENTVYDYGTNSNTNIRFNSNGHSSNDPYLYVSADDCFTASNLSVSEETSLQLSAQTKNAATITLKCKESAADDWTTIGTWVSGKSFGEKKTIFEISGTATSIDLSFTSTAEVIIDDIVLKKFVDERTTLATPANVTAEVDAATSNKINVSWGAVENAGSYEITLSTAGEEDVVETSTTNSISFTDLKYLTQYSVKVKAISSDVEHYKDSEYSAAVEVSTGAQPAVQVYYTKVTEALDDWSGEYLLVYESSATSAYVWTGVDVANCYVSAAISDNSISSLSIPTAGVTLTIATMEGGYSIKVNGGTNDGKFIYGTSGSNGLSFASSPSLNTISYADNAVSIVSNTSVLRYNNASNNNRFRYFKSTSYSSQQPVQLYKLEESELSSIVVSGTPTKTAYSVGEAFDTDGLVATATYANASTKDVTSSVEWTVTPETLSAGTTSVTVVAKYKGIQSNEYVVNGLSVKALSSITVKTAPTKTTYTEGEKFDPAGLVIYRNYSDDSKDEYSYADHEDEFTFDPDLATALATSNTSVTITYSGKSVNQSITVNETPALKTMDEIFAAATTAGSTAKDAKVKLSSWVVSGVNTKKNNIYVTDGTKGFIVFDSTKQSAGFEVGDILSGTVNCKVQLYNGSAELTSLTSTTEGLTVTKGGSIIPATISIAELSGVNTGAVITFESLQYNGTEFSDGTNVIKPYDTFITLPSLTSGRKYSVTGVYIQYNSTKEIAPRSTEDIEEIAAPKYAVTIAKGITNGNVTVDYTEATAGQTVTITATPSTGYKVKSVSAKKTASGDALTVTNNKFTMPAESVTVSAEFEVGSSATVLTFDLSKNPGSWPTTNSTTLTNYTYTLDNVNYTFGLKNVKCNSGYLMLTSTAVLGLPAIEGKKLTKVVAKNSGGCSTTTQVGISSSSSSASYISGGAIQTWSTTSSSYTYTLSGTSKNTVYYLYVTNKNAQIIELTLTYE